MNYRTTCPHCSSVFRLGEDQLGAAQGWAQCGVCGAAFDARSSLLREDGSPLPPPAAAEAAPQPETAPAVEKETRRGALPAMSEAPPRDEAPEPASPGAEDIPVADMPHGIAQREASLDLDSIILIDPEIPVAEDLGPLPQIYPAPSTYPPQAIPFPVAAPAAETPRPAAAAPAPPAARIEYAQPLPGKARAVAEQRHLPGWAWGTASVLLLALLLAQTTYFLRDTLVSRLPQTRPALEQACELLGCTLSLPRNLALLQIVGSDLQTESSGHLKLTLTLGNRASHVQAWPVLVLTLTDQRNRPLARRSFAPSEYLADPARIEAGMPPRSEQPLSLPLTVRDLTPMGFDLQLTY